MTLETIRAAADALSAGGVVALPTETVYGLAADLRQPEAIRQVFALKGRPANNPLIAHVTDTAMAETVVDDWSVHADALARRFWPGPLTMVLPRAEWVADVATAGLDTVAVRAPRHDVFQAVLRELGSPLVAPSANRSGGVSPTTAAHVAADFAADHPDLLILDGGDCRIGIESTVIDLTTDPPGVLRPGAVSIGAIGDCIGPIVSTIASAQAASPGTAARHYAPHTPARIVPAADLAAALAGHSGAVVLALTELSHEAAMGIRMPSDPVEYAHRLYAALREADASGASLILIESPPADDAAWAAIHDRLRRATAN